MLLVKIYFEKYLHINFSLEVNFPSKRNQHNYMILLVLNPFKIKIFLYYNNH